ncbi:unnamed protein product, partial [Chrysoparadoxa australica]
PAGAGLGSSTCNLVKNVVGASALALPGGVATFSASKSALIPSIGLTCALGGLSGYCFSLIGRSCAATKSDTIGEAWSRTIGDKSSWIPTATSISMCVAACIAFSVILGDIVTDLAVTFALPAIFTQRRVGLGLLASVALFPLCLLENLKPLQYTSVLGVGGTFYTAAVMALRYFDGSYAPGGRFYDLIAASARPRFEGTGLILLVYTFMCGALNPLALMLVSMLSTSFVAHYNAPTFYSELKNKSVPRYNFVVGAGYAISVLVGSAMMCFPFLTFGGNCLGFIINNYHTTDLLATLSRVAIGVSLTFGYPLSFIPMRDGILRSLGYSKPGKKTVRLATLLMVTLFTTVGILIRNLGFVIAFSGAVLGSLIAYIFPALMWMAKCGKDKKAGQKLAGWRKAEFLGQYGVIGIGVVMGVLGAGISVLETFVWK